MNVLPSSVVRGTGLVVENGTRLQGGKWDMSHFQILIEIDSAIWASLLNDDSKDFKMTNTETKYINIGKGKTKHCMETGMVENRTRL